MGTAISDGEGNFALNLTGAARFPIAIRALWLSVVGDRSGTEMTAVVAAAGTPVAVSDIVGTLTSSENAFPDSLVSGAAVAGHPGEAAALNVLRQRGYVVAYTTARGRYFTGDTRAWLESQGLPRGPLRLAPSLVTLPGQATINYKVSAMEDLGGFHVEVGIGNRATDGTAYTDVGVPSDRIFIELPEFASEVQPLIDAGEGVGFDSWNELTPVFATL